MWLMQALFRSCRSHSRRTTTKPEPTLASPKYRPQPSYKNPAATDSSGIDYLSGDAYKLENPFTTDQQAQVHNTLFPADVTPSGSKITTSPPPNLRSSPSPSVSSSSSLTPPVSRESQATFTLPPPPAKYNQRQQFFEQHSGSLNSGNGYGSSLYDNLVGQTQKLSLNSTTPKNGKSEDALFKDLVDFAKANKTSSSSSSTSKSKRSL